MANDIDMWCDIEQLDKRTSEYNILCQCYLAKYVENDNETAEKWKEVYISLFKHWNNYY